MGELYLHQKEAIHQQQQYPKCLINMWCGTGKTRTFTVDLLDDCKKMNVIVFPSLGLINQYCNDYALSSEEPFKSGFDKFKCLSFCSDNDGKLKSKGKIIFTTDEDKLKTFVKKTDNKKLVLVTYHSFEKFINICILEKINIGKLIFDEAHHIVGDKIQNIVFNNQELDNIVEQTRYYTATPVNKNGITMYDRDDPENSDCGPLAYEYLYYQAIEDKVCKPFETQISLYTQKPEYKNKYQPVFESIIRACLSGKYDYWNILTYHSLVNESEDMSDTISFVKDFASKKNQTLVKKLFTKIQNEEFPHTKVVYSVDNVILKGLYTGTKNINIILEDFDQKVPGRIYILSSCGMLNEGIDTKWANMGVPINPTKSIVKESQRIGRLVRLPEKDMPPAIILIPCEVDIAKYYSLDTPEKRDQMIREELSECGNFNTALNVISAFKYQYDPDLFEMCLRYPNMYAPKEVKDNLEKQGLIVEESQGNLLDNLKYVCEKERIELDIDGDGIGNKELLKLVAEKCDKTIEIHTQNHDEPIKYVNEESMDEEPLRLFYCEDDKTYSPIVKKDKKQTIKRKSTEPPKKRPKLFDVHMHPDLEVIWKIKESSIDFDKAFSQGVLEVDINWNVKKWYKSLENVMMYMDTNDKKPSYNDKNSETQKLGTWIGTQLTNYKTKKQIMEKENIRKSWESFVTDDKYSIYFEDNDTLWYKTLEKVKMYIDANKKRPSKGSKDTDTKQLASWIGNQLTNYKTKKDIMKNENIVKSWESFVTDDKYSEYFEDKDTLWYKSLDKVKLYIDTNKKRPSTTDKDTDAKQLAKWISHQLTNYKTKKYSMKNENIRKSWESFVTDDKYSMYFEKYIKENELVKKPPTKKDMSKPIIIPKKSSLEIKAERQQRAKSEISVLHQKYKTMTSQNLNTLFKENPEKWDEYHKISKDNEESFPEDEIPRNKMIKYLENIPGKKQKDIADLGCGFAEINQHFVNNSRFTFHNFDHHSSGELVVERDIKDTGLDDYDIDVVILSLAMWGSNCEDYLKEAHRILDTGGILLIAEPYKRWNKEVDEAEKPINRLVKLLEENEFIIKKIEEEKFMFIVCVKL